MVLGIVDDFTSNVEFDSELKSFPSSGLYVNSGVHPSLTAGNLLQFLPNLDVTFSAWADDVGYGVYSTSRNRADVVLKEGKVYQSIKTPNLAQDPEMETEYWMETNIDSLRLKAFLYSVLDRVYSELHLVKRLVNSQAIYEVGNRTVTLPADYAAWVFEPKGSDYVTIRINSVSFQKSGTTPVSLYVVNQGNLVATLQVTPSDGQVKFSPLGYTFSGKGEWKFIIDAPQTVFSASTWIDPTRFDGFYCYPASGVGASPETATFNQGGTGNGLGFDVTAYLDSSVYVDNNISEMGAFVRATFELMAFQLFQANSNNRSNRTQLIQMDENRLTYELTSLQDFTVARRFSSERKTALQQISKTFDTQLHQSDDYFVEEGSV